MLVKIRNEDMNLEMCEFLVFYAQQSGPVTSGCYWLKRVIEKMQVKGTVRHKDSANKERVEIQRRKRMGQTDVELSS